MARVVEDVIVAHGHENIRGTHKTTFEVTRDEELTPRGNCIIGVGADRSIKDIDEEIKEMLRRGARAEVLIELPDYGIKETVLGYGSSKLTFSDDRDIVVRKSNYTCGRTLLIRANKSALDLNREIIELLKDKSTIIELKILVKKI